MSVTFVDSAQRSASSNSLLPTPTGDALPHLTQLDSVRAIAVLAVMAHHCMGSPLFLEGGRGVTLFFVLSGFLITGILLKCKTYVDREGQTVGLTLRQFYLRRFLRIFPLYYMVIAVLWLIHDDGARHSLPWLLTYLTNFEHILLGYAHRWQSMTIQHFWSLAVEEQFYIVWPCVVLLVPRKRLIWVVIAVICAAPAFRLLSAWMAAPAFFRAKMPVHWFDALGLGALLALAQDNSFGIRRWIIPARRVALIFGIAGIALGLTLFHLLKMTCVAEATYYLGYAMVSVWLVSRAADGFTGITGKIMSFKPLLWIGTISYGLYVYHMIVLVYWQNLQKQHRLPQWAPWQTGLAVIACSIGLAAISFYWFEHPINAFKSRFPYRVKAVARTTDAAPSQPLGASTPALAATENS